MRRSLFSIIILLSLILSVSGPIHTVQSSSVFPLLDSDEDGISNTMETAGWYNLTGGPYITNPNSADSDQDGLTDSQEKLFNTDPTNPKSPGIAVQYQTGFKTLEYYNAKDPAYLAMTQGGNQYLLTEALVIRRGTTFKIAAPSSAAMTLTISGATMSALTPVRDPARGGWNVTVPAGGTVGTYTATISDGVWSKSIPIYVIFELPTDLTPAQVNTYLYDDDPANTRDEVAVWWRAMDWKYYNSDSTTPTACNPGDLVCSSWQYHTISGFAQAFWTEQFTKNVLVNYTLPAIQGQTNLYSAAQAIGEKADASVRINFASVKNSFSSATKVYYWPDDPIHPTTPYRTDGGACETSAGVFTAMLRSVGIAAKPFALDYNKTEGHGEEGNFAQFEHDHAVMMWVTNPGLTTKQWYAERSFNGAEDEYQATANWVSGTTGLRPLANVGIYNPANLTLQFKKFQDIFADAIQTANEGWDFQVSSSGVGMVNTAWSGGDVAAGELVPQNRDFMWNSKRPLEIQQSPYVDILNCQLWKNDGWAPSEWSNPSISNPVGRSAAQTYVLPLGIPSGVTDKENWPYNPKPVSCSNSTSTAACDAFKLTWQATCAALPGQTLADPQTPAPAFRSASIEASTLNTSIQLGKVVGDVGLDQNKDGRFDQLIVKFELSSSQAGDYQLGGWLRAGDQQIRADIARVTLATGLQTVQIAFNGQQIGDNKVNGPYQVEALWVAPAALVVSELALPEEMSAYQTYSYTSQAYPASAFAVQAASVSGTYTYTGTDTNANGRFNVITIAVPLSIAIPGTFKVEGDLYDGQSGFVGHAEWTGSEASAQLNYPVTGTAGPYSLEHLNLLDANGKNFSSFYASVYKIEDLGGKVDQSNVTPELNQTGVSPLAIIPTNLFTVSRVDTNANGLFDQVLVSATVNVTGLGGSYWIEGLLVDDQNMSVAWSVSTPQTLIVGPNQTLKLTFDGRMLFDYLKVKDNQKFTLTAVKIFGGSPGTATLEADVPVPGLVTPVYPYSSFEPSNYATTLFQDNMEGTPAKWTTTGPSQWSRTSTIWHSSTSAWVANGSATNAGLLSFAAPLNLTNYANPWLWFNTAYQLPSGQSVKLEVSTNGILWTTLKTYTGSTTYWSAEIVDLSTYARTSSVSFRFNAGSNPGAIWYIDDVFVSAGAVIQSASFTYPSPVKTMKATTLTAGYVSINTTIPTLYKWDFCGVTRQTSTPTIAYTFPLVGNCLVKLTVDNSYSSVDAPAQTISVAQGFGNFYLPRLTR